MANYNTTTKVLIGDVSEKADSVTGSIAKEISDYLQTIDTGKTLLAIGLTIHAHKLVAMIIHDS